MSSPPSHELEAALNRLQTTLRFWKTWEAEYTGLREELELEEPEPNASRMIEIAKNYGSTIIDSNEFRSILRAETSPSRSRGQVVNIIKDRIGLAERNASTIARQISLLDPHTFPAAYQAQDADEKQLEITEELDDKGDVLSSKIENYAEFMRRMQSDNVNLENVDTNVTRDTPTKQLVDHQMSSTMSSSHSDVDSNIPLGQPGGSSPVHLPMAASPLPSPSNSEMARPRRDADEMAEGVRQTLDDLRPIVASLDLEDEQTDEDYSDEDLWEENEYGMHNISDAMDENYVRQMQALVEKYEMKNSGPSQSFAVGPFSNDSHSTLPNESRNKVKVESSIQPNKHRKAENKPRKGVRFAEQLDQSEALVTPRANETIETTREPALVSNVIPLADFVVEKAPGRPISAAREPLLATSKFVKTSSRRSHPDMASNTPPVEAHVQLVDAEAVSSHPESGIVEDEEPMDFQHELAMYSQRVGRGAVDLRPFNDLSSRDEAENGNKRISRFKAARLGLRDA